MKYQGIILLFISLILSCAPAFAQEKVKPKNGDGVRSLLIRHNRPGAEYQKQFIELNKKKLGKGNSLLMGVSYTLPPLRKGSTAPKGEAVKEKPQATPQTKPTGKDNYAVGTKKREPLFGKKLAGYEIKSSELKGATFYVVSGHGGPDPGAIGKMDGHDLHEDEYAYDIGLRLARNLMMKGAKVHIIIQDAVDGIRDERILKNSKRETCMGAAIPLGQVARLNQRSAKINELNRKDGKGYARGIFIHIDSRSKSKQTDVFFYHSPKTGSKQLANTMKSTFAGKYNRHQPGRGFTGTVSERSLYVLNNTVPVSVFVELGNIQHSLDQRRIVIDDNRQALANWMCEAFVKDYTQYKKKRQ
ncbi:N-acetylmuramoyl-L-alanine amidase [Bacteroides sp. 51]|uniref:N-acetylmuramoyl-L-alanine amidase family protein n=1 Tax=Bacteroides sp. 51 TaxID=2302938 RepID=UPI0013D51775|nr:N-acetylmuramoyl-L-alanine amidase [Bacteroides sp. 51]NDV81451.1 N-acetylmuramoyl-L-alanine amidase [Bacteroides sp. 51]